MAKSNLFRKGNEQEQDKGFSLIELLVVVAIISMLVAMLIPALSRVRDASVSVSCRSNVRQLQAGWIAAMHDRGGRIPNVKNSGTEPKWTSILAGVFRDAPSIFGNNELTFASCPSVQNSYAPMYYSKDPWGYTINSWWTDDDPVVDGKSWFNVHAPAAYPWFMDGEVYRANNWYWMAHRVPFDILGGPDWGVGAHHDNWTDTNVAFADGSARGIEIAAIAREMNGPASFPWLSHD